MAYQYQSVKPPQGDKISIQNGILKVHLPKDENAKPKSIEIKVS